MKLKIIEHNGALMVSVLGQRQEFVICEEGGGFELELRECERMWWEEPLAFEPKAAQEESHPVTVSVVEPEADMFRKLAELRREIAYANGLPAYMVFHDKTLREMVESQPQNLAAFGKISGVGQAKLEKYGERFLAVIKGAA